MAAQYSGPKLLASRDELFLILNTEQCLFRPYFSLPRSQSFGGADRDRTGDPLLAKQVLSQLSYSPT